MRDFGDPAMIAALRRLLGLYPGITIDGVRCLPSGAANVTLRITNQASLARLASCAQNANLGILVWNDGSSGDWAERVQFELRAGNERDDEEFRSIENFCARMVSDHLGTGGLDQQEADRLLAVRLTRGTVAEAACCFCGACSPITSAALVDLH
jgi:hypothetical protein